MNHPKEFAEGLSIGIIMDGNGRWAKQRGPPSSISSVCRISICCSNLSRISAKPPCNIILCPFILRHGEDLFGLSVFYYLS